MRQWLIDTKILCRKHLMGEHVESHMFVGTIKKRKSLKGYFKNNLLEPKKLIERHNKLVKEMLNRGYNHKSELPEFNLNYLTEEEINNKIDKDSALKDLLNRCQECKKRYDELYK